MMLSCDLASVVMMVLLTKQHHVRTSFAGVAAELQFVAYKN